ncbi:MAG: SigB/SigF/SigG family RNA polymerase sigma factor [Actinomycetota bacterium]|nr:SigB/SigF/SigG family RNA polymerase sigma factor [Actinomycetota bacterium]
MVTKQDSTQAAPASEETQLDCRGMIETGLADESRLWADRDRDPRAREELLNRYLAYAKSIAMKFRGQAESLDDLVQVASLGLVNAVNRYDPSRGIPFVAFASPTITGELKRHFRDHTSTMRIPRSLYDRIGQVDSTVGDLTSQLNREPSVTEIAEELRTEEHEVVEAVQASRNRHPMSLDQPAAVGNQDATPPTEWLGKDDDNLDLIEERLLIRDAVEGLNEQERMVLRYRYRDELTQSEIAEKIGRSQMHVSRMLRRILDRMRVQMPDSDSD